MVEQDASTDDAVNAPMQAAAESPAQSLLAQLEQADAVRQADLLLNFVAEQVARVLGLTNAAQIDPRTPLNTMGLDSLMAVELRNRLGSGLGRSLPATLAFDYPTVDTLIDYLRATLLPPTTPASPSPAQSTDDPLGSIEDLSDDEVDALFAKRLQGLE
jgi:acyl carrier protein